MNPFNVVSLYGTILNNPVFLSHGDKEFACRFRLAVRRNYRNRQGVYENDPILVKYRFENTQFAHGLREGDTVALSGSIIVEKTQKGTVVAYVETKDVSYDERTMHGRYGANGNQMADEETAKEERQESTQTIIDLPLPY